MITTKGFIFKYVGLSGLINFLLILLTMDVGREDRAGFWKF